MPEAPANTNWFTYFPKDYRWSAAICGMVSAARWGASEIGEIDQGRFSIMVRTVSI